MSPIDSPWIRQATNYGQYGVDLFFVLSGWLIGGLYWRERQAFGNVLIWRFWVRRWLRTIPPYLIALALSYLAVYLARKEAFDFGYLLFLQNYYQRIPFFLVSWSLCVEEHFYLFVPVVFFLWPGTRSYRLNIALLLTILLVPPVFRFLQFPGSASAFGYNQTATHLQMAGLISGFLLSYISTEAPREFQSIVRKAPYVIFIATLSLPFLVFAGGRWHYALWTSVIALLFSAVVVFAVSCNEVGDILTRITRPVALASYSAYLTHPLALHIADVLMRGHQHAWAIYFSTAITLVVASAATLFFAVERTSIAVRNLWWPRRLGNADDRMRVDLAIIPSEN
jgi:peptidoglycan/LPS O-acetylase OafA/YrhL